MCKNVALKIAKKIVPLFTKNYPSKQSLVNKIKQTIFWIHKSGGHMDELVDAKAGLWIENSNQNPHLLH